MANPKKSKTPNQRIEILTRYVPNENSCHQKVNFAAKCNYEDAFLYPDTLRPYLPPDPYKLLIHLHLHLHLHQTHWSTLPLK